MTKIRPNVLSVGDRLPECELKTFDAREIEGKEGAFLEFTPQTVSTKEYFSGKDVVLITITGAFTPVCTEKQLSAFISAFDELRGEGVDEIVCISVNDVYTVAAFAKQVGALHKVSFLADGNATFARAAHLSEDLTPQQLGHRIKRSAMVVSDGVVQYIGIDSGSERESSVDSVREFLSQSSQETSKEEEEEEA